ncbi:TRAP transporter small permease subunit [Belnapia sp. T6]|uniref:TRAP transporter small permease protein n=1 Tax=Belnapia mucosa TaxID=2804532 RepID=A0ABS1V2K1_9PROT|nr:TRAP transporter small permease subunit [Belnapia mucosa]MBL6455925.1 TRAP transporter small permease subunit [Belnapia mucosa]
MRRIADGLAALCLGLAAALTAAIAAAVIWTVLARYLFGRTPAWTEELPRILMLWAVFLGMVWCTARGTNLEAGLLDLWARGPRLRAAMRALAEVLVAVFCATLAMTAAEMAEITWDGTTPALELTAAIFYLPVAIGGALAALLQLPRITAALGAAR